METKVVEEEGAKLAVPAGSGEDPFHKLAFYNPKMSFNRSVSSLALGACNGLLGEFDKIWLVDGLCATGARGVRYALENSFVKKVFFVDANEHALKLCRKNLELNKLERRGVVLNSDLNEFFEEIDGTEETGKNKEVDFVEIDPFGTPATFLPSALEKTGGKNKRGLISVTATDLAALCGKEAKVCTRNYGSKPLKCSFSHEIALRILVNKIVEEAKKMGKNAAPIFSFYQGHAVKTICLVSDNNSLNSEEKLKNKIEKSKAGFVSLCRSCLGRKWGAKQEKKCACGNSMEIAGPLWLGEIAEKSFVEKMLELLPKREYSQQKQIQKMLCALKEEIGLPPFYFDLHELASKTRGPAPKNSEVIEKLEKQGFRVSATHFSPTGIRTDAPVEEIKKLF